MSRPEKYIPKDLVLRDRLLGKDASGKAAQAPALSDVIFDLLRDNYKMADATPFFKLGTSSVGATELSIVSFTCPTNMKGVLKFFGQGAKTSDAFNFLTWRLYKNGIALADFGNLSGQVGSISSPKPITERMNGGDLIDFRAISSSGTYETYGLLEGWYWSV